MATGQRWERLADGQILRRFERSTNETTAVSAPVFFYEDFQNLSTTFETAPSPWAVAESTGTADVAVDLAGGQLKLATTTASSDQKAFVTFAGDNRCFDMGATTTTKYLQFEARVKYETGGGNDAGGHHLFIGMGNNVTATVTGTNFLDMGGIHVGFDIGPGMTTASATEDFSIHCVTDDTTNDNDVDSASDVTDGTFHIFRFDTTDKTDVRFYLDGTRLAAGSTFDISNVTADEGLVQPAFCLYKHTTEGDGEAMNAYIDYVKIWGIR